MPQRTLARRGRFLSVIASLLAGVVGSAVPAVAAAIPVTWTQPGGAEQTLLVEPVEGTVALTYVSRGETEEEEAAGLIVSQGGKSTAYGEIERLLTSLGIDTAWIFREEGSTGAETRVGALYLQEGVGAVRVPAIRFGGAVYADAHALFEALNLRGAVGINTVAGTARFDVQLW